MLINAVPFIVCLTYIVASTSRLTHQPLVTVFAAASLKVPACRPSQYSPVHVCTGVQCSVLLTTHADANQLHIQTPVAANSRTFCCATTGLKDTNT